MIPTNLSFPLKFPACNDAGAWFIFKQLYCLTVGLTGIGCRDLKTWELKTTKHNHCGLLSCAENVFAARVSPQLPSQHCNHLPESLAAFARICSRISLQESVCKNQLLQESARMSKRQHDFSERKISISPKPRPSVRKKKQTRCRPTSVSWGWGKTPPQWSQPCLCAVAKLLLAHCFCRQKWLTIVCFRVNVLPQTRQ